MSFTQLKHLMFIVAPFFVLSTLVFPADQDLILQQTVLEELLGRKGLFAKSEEFRNLYTVNFLIKTEQRPGGSSLIADLKRKRLKDKKTNQLAIRLQVDEAFERVFQSQLDLIFKNGEELYRLILRANEAAAHLKSHSRIQRAKSTGGSFFWSMIVTAKLIMIAQPNFGIDPSNPLLVVGAFIPPFVTFRYLLALPFSREARRNYWASQHELQTEIKSLVNLTRAELKIPVLDQNRSLSISGLSNSEVIVLKYLPDGSPLIVLKEELLSAFRFRNSLKVFKVKYSELLMEMNQAFYPCREFYTPVGVKRVPKFALEYAAVLVPPTFHGKADGDIEQQVDSLKNQLVLFLNNQTPYLSSTRDANQISDCMALRKVGGM